MPPFDAAAGAIGNSSVVRIVEGRSGRVAVRTELVLRFDYGASTPWVVRLDEWFNGIIAIAGPNLAVLRTPVKVEGRDMETVGEFVIEAGQSVPFVLTYGPSHIRLPTPLDPITALRETEAFWSTWSGRCTYRGEWREAVIALADHFESSHFPADGRHRRGCYHVAARATGRGTELGLPHLLAA
jgi:hypothetical protein